MKTIGIECETIEDDSWGLARIVKRLLEEIARRPELKNEFKFVLFFKEKIPDYSYLADPIFEKKIIKVPSWLPIKFNFYYHIWLPIYLWFHPVDVMFWPNYLLSPLFFGTAIVDLTEDVYYEMRNSNIPFRFRLAYWIFTNWAAIFATRLMTFSHTSKHEVSRLFGIKPGRIIANPLGVDTPETVETENNEGEYLLFVGQTFPRRHLKETLQAFEKIAPDFPDLRFIVVGPDRYRPPVIKKLAAQINQNLGGERMVYYERVSDQKLAVLCKYARAITYISHREAFGLPPVEGLVRGAVPVVAETPVSRELFGDNAIFTQFSVDSIAQGLRQALTDAHKRQEILVSAQEVAARYTWSAYTDRFLEAVKSL